ncbi:hypothetical protein N1031_14680 [Herbiconiux moechotypicola]|uniref:Lipoprotein n=1 Tax=Herbiconiux moechotypicola TaxID=637393 RepID=A0ABN3DUT9_9MICO|nr:hypothetical protein [Herbiconiux moechotypicola]MCS5731009.1 hypothetical protein [Herbiconiux moechotypicola]
MLRSHSSRLVTGALALLAAVPLLAGCVDGGATEPTASATSTPSPTRTATATPTPTPSPEPTTPPVEPTPTPTASTPAVSAVTVELINSGYDPSTGAISVAGMVTDLVSQTGVCTVSATQADTTLTAQAAGMADATVTYCSGLTVGLPAGSSGSWTVSLSFADETHSGQTQTTVQVG